MTDCCIAAGMPSDAFICDTSGLPACSERAVSVATDDIILFERRGGDSYVPGRIAPWFSQLDNVWKDRGIQSKVGKQADRVDDGIALGLQLLKGTHLLPKPERLYDLICGLIYLLETRRVSKNNFDLLWCIAMDTTCQSPATFMLPSYLWLMDAEDDQYIDIPGKVLNELGLIVTLLFATAIDLRAEWAPCVWATDGAESFGYGGTCAPCHPDVTRQLASHVHLSDHQFVPADIWNKKGCDTQPGFGCLCVIVTLKENSACVAMDTSTQASWKLEHLVWPFASTPVKRSGTGSAHCFLLMPRLCSMLPAREGLRHLILLIV